MQTPQSSSPHRKNSKNDIRDYGSSGVVANYQGLLSSSSPHSYSHGRKDTKDANTGFHDSDFGFDFDFEFDAISESSNDVLVTIDEGVRLEVDNVSALYNNAADGSSNKRASIFADAGDSAATGRILLTKKRLVFALVPALAIEFSRVFASLFMLLNLNSVFGYYNSGDNNYHYVSDLSLPFSGVLGVCLVQGCALRLRTLKTSPDQMSYKRNVLLRYYIAYQIIFVVSAALVVGMCWSIVDLENGVVVVSRLNSSMFASRDEEVVTITAPPIVFLILLMVGYILVTSVTVSGQYIILSFASHFDSNVLQQNASSVIVVWTAMGGVSAGCIGILDTVSNWCPRDDCTDHVTANAAILSSVSLFLALVCFITSLSAIYFDYLRELWERIVLYRKTHFFIDPNHKAQTQYRSNDNNKHRHHTDTTAQEDFDECAALLEASGHSFSSSHFTGHSVGSQNTLLDNDVISGSASSPNVKIYAHQIPVPFPTLKKMLAKKSFLTMVVLIMFLSCLSAIFQYYTPKYLANTVFSYHGPLTTNSSSGTVTQNNADGVLGSGSTVGRDSGDGTGLKLACAGTFVHSLVFLVVFVKRKWISNSINLRLKPWFCPILLLAMSVFTITLVATNAGEVYLVTAFVFGMVRVAEAEMLHTIARRLDRSWPITDQQDVTSTPKSLVWSLVPTSQVVSSLLVTALTAASSHNPHTPMICVTVIAALLVLTFGMSRVYVI